jgi:FKBP12-rapamycin complex-associated protein
MALAEKTINSLLSPVHGRHVQAPPDVVYTQLKFMWANGAQQDSLLFLRQFTTTINSDLEAEASKDPDARAAASNPRVARLSKLLARCYFKLGEWEAQLRPDWASVSPCVLGNVLL